MRVFHSHRLELHVRQGERKKPRSLHHMHHLLHLCVLLEAQPRNSNKSQATTAIIVLAQPVPLGTRGKEAAEQYIVYLLMCFNQHASGQPTCKRATNMQAATISMNQIALSCASVRNECVSAHLHASNRCSLVLEARNSQMSLFATFSKTNTVGGHTVLVRGWRHRHAAWPKEVEPSGRDASDHVLCRGV